MEVEAVELKRIAMRNGMKTLHQDCLLIPDYALEKWLYGSSWYLDGLTVVSSITQTVNLPIEYCDKAVAPFVGMTVIKRFLDQVGIREKSGSLDLDWSESLHAL